MSIQENTDSKLETFKLEQGYFETPVYEYHRRGKNWGAVVYKDLNSPGGLKREWLERAVGASDHYSAANLKVNDTIELASKYYSASGNLGSYTRLFYKVVYVSESELKLRQINRSEVNRLPEATQ